MHACLYMRLRRKDHDGNVNKRDQRERDEQERKTINNDNHIMPSYGILRILSSFV